MFAKVIVGYDGSEQHPGWLLRDVRIFT